MLTVRFRDTKEAVHSALADNFNSRAAIFAIGDLINDLNKECKAANINATHTILLEITNWITQILSVFGFPLSKLPCRLGWAEDRDPLLPELKKGVRYRDAVRARAISKSGIDEIENLTFQLDSVLSSSYPAFAPYRQGIKDFADSISKALVSDYLKECDRFRDETMLELGVSIDDTDFGIASIRFADATQLVADRDRKRLAESVYAEKKEAEKLRRKEEEERKAKEKLEKGKIPPSEMFRTKEYSQWDEEV